MMEPMQSQTDASIPSMSNMTPPSALPDFVTSSDSAVIPASQPVSNYSQPPANNVDLSSSPAMAPSPRPPDPPSFPSSQGSDIQLPSVEHVSFNPRLPPTLPPPPVMPTTTGSGSAAVSNPYSIQAASMSSDLTASTALPMASAMVPLSSLPPKATGSNPAGAVPVSTFIPSAPAEISPTQVAPLESPISSSHNYGSAGPPAPAVGVQLFEGDGPEGQGGQADSSDGGLFGWISNSTLFHKVAEKAKTSVDSVITTLDPQMKDYINSVGAVEFAVASDEEIVISGIREGFQRIFSQVYGRGLGAPAIGGMIAVQPRGFDAALEAVTIKIASLRQSGLVDQAVPVIGVQSFVVELTPKSWAEMSCLVLDDIQRQCQLTMYTQPAMIGPEIVQIMESQTPASYPLRGSGYAISPEQAFASLGATYGVEWHPHVCGFSRRDLMNGAAYALAFAYRAKLGY